MDVMGILLYLDDVLYSGCFLRSRKAARYRLSRR